MSFLGLGVGIGAGGASPPPEPEHPPWLAAAVAHFGREPDIVRLAGAGIPGPGWPAGADERNLDILLSPFVPGANGFRTDWLLPITQERDEDFPGLLGWRSSSSLQAGIYQSQHGIIRTGAVPFSDFERDQLNRVLILAKIQVGSPGSVRFLDGNNNFAGVETPVNGNIARWEDIAMDMNPQTSSNDLYFWSTPA